MFFMLSMFVVLGFFFFFKQKTAYEMRISDWSSDVCSSDLQFLRRTIVLVLLAAHDERRHRQRREHLGRRVGEAVEQVPRRDAVDLHRLHELDRQPGVVAAFGAFIFGDPALVEAPAPPPAGETGESHAAEDQLIGYYARNDRAHARLRAEPETAAVAV